MGNESEIDVKNLTIDGFTTPCPITVGENATISEIISTMDENEVRHIPVINDKSAAIGIITNRDVATVKSFAFNADIKAKDLMTPDPVHVNEHTPLIEAAFLMSSKKLGSLIVTNTDEEVTGIFTNTDALNALVEVLRGEILESDL